MWHNKKKSNLQHNETLRFLIKGGGIWIIDEKNDSKERV